MGGESVAGAQAPHRSLSIAAWQAKPGTESPAELVARHNQGEPRVILDELVRLERASQPGLWGQVKSRGANAINGAAIAGGVGLFIETGGGVLLLGGGPVTNGLLAGSFAALGGIAGACVPVNVPLRMDGASDAALARAGAALTLTVLNTDLPADVKSSFRGVGSFLVGAPAQLTLVFDAKAFKEEHLESLRRAVLPHLKQMGLEELVPRFVRFRVALV